MKKMEKMIGSMSMKTVLISVLLCSNVTNLFPANCMCTYCIFIVYCEYILYRNSKPTEKEIATTLILLKTRHKLSNTCIRDMCHLLRILKVHNAPKSYSRITRIFHRETHSSNKASITNICIECNQVCTNHTSCGNVECSQHTNFEKPPFQFVCMPILPQLRDILARAQYLNFQRQGQSFQPTSTIKDIFCGAAYDRILLEQSSTRFILLLMNVDGISIDKSSNTSLWVITFVINELKRTERFKLKNVIVAGVLSSKTKPSRDLIYAVFTPIVHELKQLEYGRYFHLAELHSQPEPLRIFLLGACLDKPAQALIQNLREPTAEFGCGRCELAGMFVFFSLSMFRCLIQKTLFWEIINFHCLILDFV